MPYSINRTRDDDTVKVTIFGVPARHTKKRLAMATESAYGSIRPDEVRAMSEREKHFLIRLDGEAFNTYTFKIVEVPA